MTNKALPYMDLFREGLGSLVDYFGPIVGIVPGFLGTETFQERLNRERRLRTIIEGS
jgi:hypothetical protein